MSLSCLCKMALIRNKKTISFKKKARIAYGKLENLHKELEMNKADLVSTIATEMKISLSQSEEIMSVFLQGIAKSLKKGETVTLVGFGRFGVKKRAARKVRNPRTGVEMQIKEKNVPYFKAGKELKASVDSQT